MTPHSLDQFKRKYKADPNENELFRAWELYGRLRLDLFN